MDFPNIFAPGSPKPSYSQTVSSNLSLNIPSTSTALAPIGTSRPRPQAPNDYHPFIYNPPRIVNTESSKCKVCAKESETDLWKCINCAIHLCHSCKLQHTQLHNTHRFLKHEIRRRHYHSGSLSSTSTNSQSPPLRNFEYCEFHNQPNALFCKICSVPACSSCYPNFTDEFSHRLVSIREMTDKTKMRSYKYEVDTIIGNVKECLLRTESTKSENDLIYKKAQHDLGLKLRSIQQAFTKFVQQLNEEKRNKDQFVNNYRRKLDLILEKLRDTSESLYEATLSQNTMQIVRVKNQTERDLAYFHKKDMLMISAEDCQTGFVPPSIDNTLMRIFDSGNKTVRLPMTRVLFGAEKTVVRKFTDKTKCLKVGGPGEDEGQLARPWGVCCDKQGYIIVGDRSNDRIQVFNPDGSFMSMFGHSGSKPGELNRPAGVAINPRNQIVVADKDNHRIQIFTLDGRFIHTFGKYGLFTGQLNYPWDVACNSQGHIVVSDSRNHRIQLFDEGGTVLRRYGPEANGQKILDSPRGVAFTPVGDIIFTDFNTHKYGKIDIITNRITFFGCEGHKLDNFQRPQGIICDDNGNIIIGDSKNERVKVLDYKGNFLWSIDYEPRPKTEPKDIDVISGIALTPSGQICVVDYGNHLVQIF